jgi:hypothetical protein
MLTFLRGASSFPRKLDFFSAVMVLPLLRRLVSEVFRLVLKLLQNLRSFFRALVGD